LEPGREPLAVIGVVGEIYTVLEPFVNLNAEKRLGAMGIEVRRKLFISDWIREHLFRFKVKTERAALEELAWPFLNGFVGGHGLESVAHTVQFAREGTDGVIQLAPLTCMPEIVAETVLPDVSSSYNIPVLTVFLDEHTGEAGLVTRLEAFTDLLKSRRARVADAQFAPL
jgi:predicted nucleotide-binding protein (sugar kinase/HSP70/actin superfamily)